MIEMNVQRSNHVMYVRRQFPYVDYFNRYLSHVGKEVPCLDLKVIVYTDTSNLAYQLISQNSRMLKSTKGYKSMSAHWIRYGILYSIVGSCMAIIDANKLRALAEKLVVLEEFEMFKKYRVLALLLEWLANYPTNFMILHELKEKAKNIYYDLTTKEKAGGLTAEMKTEVEKVLGSQSILTDNHLRHELVSLNDYVRKNKKIVSTIVDDEMVLFEIKKYLKNQSSWLESSRLL